MSKKVTFAAKPRANQNLPQAAEEWVNTGQEHPDNNSPQSTPRDSTPRESTPQSSSSQDAGEAMKRLTIDIPKSLHTQIKTQCAARGVKMADEIRDLLARHFSEVSGEEA